MCMNAWFTAAAHPATTHACLLTMVHGNWRYISSLISLFPSLLQAGAGMNRHSGFMLTLTTCLHLLCTEQQTTQWQPLLGGRGDEGI